METDFQISFALSFCFLFFYNKTFLKEVKVKTLVYLLELEYFNNNICTRHKKYLEIDELELLLHMILSYHPTLTHPHELFLVVSQSHSTQQKYIYYIYIC